MSEVLLRLEGLAAPHGFATRAGGVSVGPWRGLNLGLGTGDEPAAVERNRQIFLGHFGATRESVALLQQVHGDRVVEARPPRPAEEAEEADAQISDDPGLLLLISTADCLPILFHDPVSGAVAAAHCGWRGTVAGLAARVVRALGERHGSRPQDLVVAIGPGICRGCYQVDERVAQRFEESGRAEGALEPDGPGHWRLDLEVVNRRFLEEAGVPEGNVLAGGWCTSCQPESFYSHRRDRGVTGRHWAAIRATPPAG